jgi:hypothetical protein
MGDKSQVKVTFLGDATALAAASRKAQASLDGVGKQASKFGPMVKAGAAIAGVAAVKFGADSVRAFAEAEESQARLSLAYKKFPKLADVSIASLRNYNSELAKKVAFDDDALASGQAVLAQFNLTGKQIQSLTPLMADYAAKTGQDLPTAATLMGKAFLGNTKALKALGINYKSTGDKTKDVANIQALLQAKIGGTAEAMGKTATGKAAILRNQFGELQETVGSKLLPVLTRLTEIGLKVVDFISRNSAVIMPLVAVVGTLIVGIKLWTMAQAALNVVMALNPIGLAVIAVAALVAGVVIAYKKVGWFRDGINALWGGIKAAFGWVRSNWPLLLAILTGPFGLTVLFISKHWDAIVGFVQKLPGRIGAAASGMWDGIKNSFRSAVNWIIQKWNDLHFTIGGGSVFGQKLPSVTLNTPNIPMLAKGGDITRGGAAVVGDAGPEILDLPAGARVTPLGRGGGVSGGVQTVRVELTLGGRVIHTELLRLKRELGGSLGLA